MAADDRSAAEVCDGSLPGITSGRDAGDAL